MIFDVYTINGVPTDYCNNEECIVCKKKGPVCCNDGADHRKIGQPVSINPRCATCCEGRLHAMVDAMEEKAG